MTLKGLAAAGSFLIAAAAGAAATAAEFTSGETVVNPTAPLGALGLSATPIGDAEINGSGYFSFPVTGGELNGLAGDIEHDNSGLELSDGSTAVQLENFVIDTVNMQVNADVSLNGAFQTNTAILSFDVSTLPDINDLFDLSNPMLSLVFTDGAADLLESVYSLNAQLNGVEFGLAATAPEVPIPGAIGLFLAGAAALNFMRRRSTNPAPEEA